MDGRRRLGTKYMGLHAIIARSERSRENRVTQSRVVGGSVELEESNMIKWAKDSDGTTTKLRI